MTTLSTEVAEAVRLLRQQADEIANAGHNGWGNTMILAADELERLHARVRELIEGKDYGPFERQINDLQMQNANCVKENLRLRAELEQARAEIERLKTINYRSPCVGGA